MKILLLQCIFSITILSALAQSTEPSVTIKKLWETPAGLKVPESVLYDTASKVIFVSSVNGMPADKDNNGFISTLSVDGKIMNESWLTGLDAPKGMGILNNHLFVTNIDEVVEIDIPTAKIINRFPVKSSKFLNDIAIDPKSGMIFITDTSNGEVFVLFEGKVTSWLQGPMFKGANGLFLSDSMLYIGTGNNILQADIKSGEVVVAISNSGGVDGLYLTADGNFIYSDFKGSVFMANPYKKKRILLLNTTDQKANAADFGVITSKKMILIPTFADNKVVCYSLSAIN
jgi:DNA-binding beta-propeller fold protein YncE